MDGIPDNQSSHNIFDAFLRTTKSQSPHSVPHNIKLAFLGNKKLFLIPAVGLLTVGIPLAVAESFSNDLSDVSKPGTNSSSPHSSTNNQSAQFQQETNASGSSSSSKSSLTVNGRSIPLPENGHLEHTLSDGAQSTHIQVDNYSEQNTEGDNTSNTSSSSINIRTNSVNESRGSP